jgi:hypothetical protein
MRTGVRNGDYVSVNALAVEAFNDLLKKHGKRKLPNLSHRR